METKTFVVRDGQGVVDGVVGWLARSGETYLENDPLYTFEAGLVAQREERQPQAADVGASPTETSFIGMTPGEVITKVMSEADGTTTFSFDTPVIGESWWIPHDPNAAARFENWLTFRHTKHPATWRLVWAVSTNAAMWILVSLASIFVVAAIR